MNSMIGLSQSAYILPESLSDSDLSSMQLIF